VKAGLWTFVLLLLFSAAAQAHMLPKQTATMNIIDKAAFFVVSVPASALGGVDDDGNGQLSLIEIGRHNQEIQRQFAARFQVRNAGKPGRAALTWALSPVSDGSTTQADYVVVMHRVDFAAAPENPEISTSLFGSKPGEGQMTVKATHRVGADKISEVAILEPNTPAHVFFRGNGAIFMDFVRVGLAHILTGPDHLLFLLTIVVASAGWRYWLAIITGFTIAHSITLAFSALGVIRISPDIIEPGIAASIVVMALLNLWFSGKPDQGAVRVRIAVVFACGLLHGFGFASAIGGMATGTGNRVAALAGFNVGIEIGQFMFVAAVSLVILVVAKLGRFSNTRRVPQIASVVAASLGSILMVQRLAGI
jgi:hydrogenase/urease accessory protein HupE